MMAAQEHRQFGGGALPDRCRVPIHPLAAPDRFHGFVVAAAPEVRKPARGFGSKRHRNAYGSGFSLTGKIGIT